MILVLIKLRHLQIIVLYTRLVENVVIAYVQYKNNDSTKSEHSKKQFERIEQEMLVTVVYPFWLIKRNYVIKPEI